MSDIERPSRHFVRLYTPDPEEQDADEQEDLNCTSLAEARRLHAKLKAQGLRAEILHRVHMTPQKVGSLIVGWDYSVTGLFCDIDTRTPAPKDGET